MAEAPQNVDEAALLGAVSDMVAELHGSTSLVPVQPASRLDADLGLDSLSLVELRVRLEDVFGVVLPDSLLATGVIAGDWLRAVRAARGTAGGRQVLPPHPFAGDGIPTVETRSPSEARTLLEALDWHVLTHPDRVGLRILRFPEGAPVMDELTYRALLDDASRLANGLQQHGLPIRGTVAIMLPTGRDYFGTFLAVLLAGSIPVPLYPPARPEGLEDHLRRQVHILQNAGAALLVTDPAARRLARLLKPQVGTLRAVVTPDELRANARGSPERPRVDADDIALIQYTSGSTGRPKGVVLAHRHLIANIVAMGAGAEATPADVFVSWLPLYHDMGLIASWLGSLLLGFELVVMAPLDFLARPVRWLEAFGASRGTLTASPNFGYELCVRHVTDADVSRLDLSSWRLAFNGAEPVSPGTLSRFAERFAPAGFRPEVMTPVYGLAEAGVAVTFPPLGRGPLVDSVDRHSLTHEGRAIRASSDDPDPLHVVACGRPLPGYDVRVVDSGDRQLGDRQEGRIQFTGPSATPGYFSDPQASAELFSDGWVETGDLGYLADGELYLTGRSKDIVIRAGRNLHPEELEESVGTLAGVRKGCVAVFSSPDPRLGTERLVVLAETRLQGTHDLADLRGRIMSTAVEVLGTPPDEVVLAPPGTVLKTSSGKIRRGASRRLYEQGAIGHRRSGRRQVVLFAARAAFPQLCHLVGGGVDVAYAGYVWCLALVIGAPTWLLVVSLPRLRWRWAVLRWAGWLLARMAGVEIEVQGAVPDNAGLVVVSNHSSFVDGLAVVLCVGSPVSFVAGWELETQRIAGPFLTKLGCEFLRPGDPPAMRAQADRFVEELRAGRRMAFFPEGSLSRAPGLRQFHLGAFAVACGSGAPVVPLGISGSRNIVHPGTKFPRRGVVRVVVGSAIRPQGSDWSSAVTLRDRARDAVSSLSGEVQLA